MKPKTKLQWRVNNLGFTLPPITLKHLEWAKDHIFDKYAYTTKKAHNCPECNHKWEYDKITKKVKCPNCKTELMTRKDHIRRIWDEQYYTILSTHHEFQVVRHIRVTRFGKINDFNTNYGHLEICQHWVAPDGKCTIRSLMPNGMGYGLKWCLSSSMEIRNDHNRYYVHAPIYPHHGVKKIIYRNGFKGDLHRYHPAYLFSMILSDNIAETLLKTDQIGLLNEILYKREDIVKYWSSVRICIRNNYFVEDASVWLDHMKLLEWFGKDLHSPKYVCPEELYYEHAKYSEKKAIMEDDEEAEEKAKKELLREAEYEKMRGPYLGLYFGEGDITISVLQSIHEFRIEGRTMHHCVFANQYYTNEDTLIMSAKYKGQRMETIQFNIDDLRIVQSRGLQNQPTIYHNKIIEIVEKNINNIKQVRDDLRRHENTLQRDVEDVKAA